MDEQVGSAHRPAVDERIELAYTPTMGDYQEALAARARSTRSGRRTRKGLYVVAACAVIGAASGLAKGEGIDAPGVISLLVGAAFLLLVPRLQARQFHRLAADKGEFHVTVEASGVTIANRQSSSTLTWQATPSYVETPGLFVLLSGDKSNACLSILPKRGTADPDRLRALLAEHATAL
ncbi:YcxB family protein [Kitasatospora brasiliensis]|uniref:YcxB family protein n=1 Tax=Kitasatospora brasiliensis TaxID=3058040 RepID=UPI00293075B2|nr:YcxB family protein [Kitasatospora sp. K002]